MTPATHDIFYSTISSWQWVAHTQNDMWCRSMADATQLRYFLDNRQPASMGCVGYVRQKGPWKMLCIMGDCYRTTPSAKQVRDFYKNIPQLGFDIVEINLNSLYSPEYEVGMRLAGLLRPVGLFSTTLSKYINIQQPLSFDKSWQRNLKQCQQYELTFNAIEQPSQVDIQTYMQMHNEMIERKQFSGYLSQPQLTNLLQDPHFLLTTVTHQNNTIAGMVLYKENNNRAVSLYSVTTPEGRNLSASYWLYKETFTHLAQNSNVHTFDIGRLAPSNADKNSVFLFKNGIDGQTVQYNGEWLWCKKKWMPLALYFLKKYVWKRTQV